MGKIDLFKTVSNISDKSKQLINDVKANAEIDKITKRQDEHKYNIGEMVLEKGIYVDDKLISSNLKSIKKMIGELEDQ